MIRILDRLGAARVGGREAFTSFEGTVDQHEAIDAGFRMLESGEDGLRKFLDELFETAEPANGNWGPREAYGLIYDWLNRDRIHGGTLFDPIRNIVAEHALANIPLNPKEPLFGFEIPARRLFTLHHVWTETGIHPDRLRHILIALDLIDADTAKRENWQIILNGEGLRKVEALAREMLDRNQARAYLGIPRGILPSILEAGLLTPLTQGGDAGKGSMVFRRSELDRWIEQLAGDAPLVSHVPPGLDDIVATSRRSQWTSAAIIEALLQGRLKAAGKIAGKQPFMSILVDVDETKKLMIAACEIPAITGIGWNEAFAEIGCSHYTLKELVAVRAIGCTRLKSVSRGNTVPVFEPEEIARFKREYISMKDAAKYLDAHSRSVAAKVAPLGITPAIEIKDLPASSYFLRSEIEACEQYAFESVRTRKSRLERALYSESPRSRIWG